MFDYSGISQHTDAFFVMAYDTFGTPAVAHAGGRLPELGRGLREYVRLGVRPVEERETYNNKPRVCSFPGFVHSCTRTTHGAYVQLVNRNRFDRPSRIAY